MNKLIKYLVGIFCIGFSLSIVIIYSNLLIYGLGIKDFLLYIVKTWEFYLLPLGIYLIIKR